MKVILTLLLALLTLGAKPPEATPTCWFDPATTVNGIDFPIDTEIRVSFDYIGRTGAAFYTPTGTFSLQVADLTPGEHTAYFYQRGRGGSLFKMPPGLGDYHVIAYCSTVI